MYFQVRFSDFGPISIWQSRDLNWNIEEVDVLKSSVIDFGPSWIGFCKVIQLSYPLQKLAQNLSSRPLEGFFSNSKSHSQPIRIEHQLSLNWTRNSITKVAAALVGGWASRLKITNNVMLWYPYRRHLSHSSTVKELEGLKVITHLIIIIKFNLIYFWGGLVIMSPFFQDSNLFFCSFMLILNFFKWRIFFKNRSLKIGAKNLT